MSLWPPSWIPPPSTAQLTDFLATWDWSAEVARFLRQSRRSRSEKVKFLDTLNARLGLRKELRNLLAVLISNDRIGAVGEVAAGLSQLVAASSWASARLRL